MSFGLRLSLALCALVVALAFDNPPASWPQFRGPDGAGIAAAEANPPAQFGPAKAVLWNTPLPAGHGSPCIWSNRIFVTAFDKDTNKLELIALDRATGKIAWRQAAPAAAIETVHAISSPATSTPLSDGQHIYVYFGSFGLLAYDWNGKSVWQYPLPLSNSPYGSGTSPVLAGDLIVLTRDYPPEPEFLAVSRQDGKLAWKVPLPLLKRPGPMTAHSTPAIWKDQVILHRPGDVSGYSLKDGARRWWVNLTTQGTSTPVVTADAVYVTAFSITGEPDSIPEYPPFSDLLQKYDRNHDGKLSRDELPDNDVFLVKRVGVADNVPGAHFTLKLFFRMVDANHDGFVEEKEWTAMSTLVRMFKANDYGLTAITPGGEGDRTSSAVLWQEHRGVPEVPAPLSYHGRVYMIANGGVASCVDSKSGKLLFRGRVGAPGAYYASPVAAGGKIFVASSDGVVTTLAEGDTLNVLANNDLGEPVFGTPALIGPAVYVRSLHHLWAFQK